MMGSSLDAFMPDWDIRERFSVVVKAPSHVVYRAACEFDMQSPGIVRTILWLRAKLLRSENRNRPAHGLVEEMQAIGWGCLTETPGELFLAAESQFFPALFGSLSIVAPSGASPNTARLWIL